MLDLKLHFPSVQIRMNINNFSYILQLLSLLSLILASVGAGNIPWPHWMGYVLIGSNMSVLCRILPSILTKQEEKTSAFKVNENSSSFFFPHISIL